MMAISRHFLARLMGLGPDDYGIMTYRYLHGILERPDRLHGYVGCILFYQRLRIAQRSNLPAAELQTKLVKKKPQLRRTAPAVTAALSLHT